MPIKKWTDDERKHPLRPDCRGPLRGEHTFGQNADWRLPAHLAGGTALSWQWPRAYDCTRRARPGLLNLEAVLTALLAWIVFKEHADHRIVLGMIAIAAGGVILSVPSEDTGSSSALGPVLIAIACLCWAIDNNLTRKVSASDALFIAGSKGLIAGTVSSLLALLTGALLSSGSIVLSVMAIGLFGYGISLVSPRLSLYS